MKDASCLSEQLSLAGLQTLKGSFTNRSENRFAIT